METDVARSLLERSDPNKLTCSVTDIQERGEGELMVPYLMDCRRKQKLMCQQLCMLDDMIAFLTELKSPGQLLSDSQTRNPDSNARKQWKELKKQYEQGLGQVEILISALQDRIYLLQNKQQKLQGLIHSLEKKKEESKLKQRIRKKKNQAFQTQMSLQLDDSLQKARNALRLCDRQIKQMTEETDVILSSLDNFSSLRDKLLEYIEGTEGLMQYKVVCVSPSELCVEMKPAGQLEPLRVIVTTSPNERFHLQVFQGTTGFEEESLEGHMHQFSATLLEVMQHYVSQGEKLAEIQSLHSRFAIDWRPAQKLLVFLKSASVVCHLEVGEGYPSSGHVTLLSVLKDGSLTDISALQPPKTNPTLSDWLEYLSSCPNV